MLDLLESRREIYGLLARLLSYPLTEEVLERLQKLEPVSDTAPELGAAVCALKSAINAPTGSAALLEELNAEHSRLLAGPGLPVAPPYGTWYLDRTRTLFGPETQAVAAGYRERGYEPNHPGVPADHVALELEFMAILASQALEAGAAGSAEWLAREARYQLEFLQRHLLPLARGLASRIREESRHRFFLGLADLLEGYLSLDAACLADVVAAVASAGA